MVSMPDLCSGGQRFESAPRTLFKSSINLGGIITKKIITFVLIFSILFGLSFPVYAWDDFEVLDMGEYLTKVYNDNTVRVEFKNPLYDCFTKLYINDLLDSDFLGDEVYWWNANGYPSGTHFYLSSLLLGESSSEKPYAIPLSEIKEDSQLTLNFYFSLEAWVTDVIRLSTPYIAINQYDSNGDELVSQYFYLNIDDTVVTEDSVNGTYTYSGIWEKSVTFTTEKNSAYAYFLFVIPDSVLAGGDVNIELLFNSLTLTCDYSVFEENSKLLNDINSKLDNVNSSINQGFDSIGGKLDDMLIPDQNNQQAVDQMGSQVNSNKQEAGDIKDQIDSLDKPDPDDLIDQIDPDQFIDSEDEAVQEMTGIIASVTGNKVVKNYLLILACIGIISFVVYGKKGG